MPPRTHNQPADPLATYLEDLQEVAQPILERLNTLIRAQAPKVPVDFTELDHAQKGVTLALIIKDLLDSLEIVVKQNRKPLDEMSALLRTNGDAWAATGIDLYRALRQRIAAYQDGLPPGSQIRTEYGELATIRDHWMIEVTDPDQVPPPYRSPDPAKLRAAVKAGVRAMPGVRIWREPQLVLMEQK